MAIISSLQQQKPTPKGFSLQHNRLMYKDKFFVPKTSDWRSKLLYEFYSSLIASHSGYLCTFVHLFRSFAWHGMRTDVKQFVAACNECQRQSYETINPPGLLQPLHVPENVWLDMFMDFIDGLPNSQGHNAILVVADRLSKYTHFIAISHPYSATQIAETFVKNISCLHGMPRTIVSDRNTIFLSQFWESFFKLQGTKLCRNSAYHPQSNDQTKVVNRCLEHYLRCFIADKPSSWSTLLHWAEWWYNTTHHSTINMSPFQALYDIAPPSVSMYVPGSTAVHVVDVTLCDCDTFLRTLKSHMSLAQNRMKQHSDQHRTECTFAEGDWVYLKLHPYLQ